MINQDSTYTVNEKLTLQEALVVVSALGRALMAGGVYRELDKQLEDDGVDVHEVSVATRKHVTIDCGPLYQVCKKHADKYQRSTIKVGDKTFYEDEYNKALDAMEHKDDE